VVNDIIEGKGRVETTTKEAELWLMEGNRIKENSVEWKEAWVKKKCSKRGLPKRG
jgi:hypothetical protein